MMITSAVHVCRVSIATAAAALFLLSLSISRVDGQFQSYCDKELGQAGWTCDSLAPVSPAAFEEFLSLPGSPDPSNPVKYKQIAGEPAFDEVTGMRNNNSAVFVLTEGTFFCMVTESNGEAALFDAPEGSFVSSTTQYPTSSWIPESMEALLAEETKLKYIVYTHAHWDHIGAAGIVADHFVADNPMAISSRRPRLRIKKKNKNDPTTSLGNNRGVPLPVWYEDDMLKVGGLQFELQKTHAHQAGDYLIFLDKKSPANSAEGIATSVVMVTDTTFPGWSPFFFLAVTQDTHDYYEGIQEINGYDFDVLVGGHLTRLGTKEDAQIKVDYFADILAGAELGISTVMVSDIVMGTGIGDPTNPNFGNTWLLLNEYMDSVVDVCYDYVLDSSARGRDWLTDLSGVDITLRSHCWTVQNLVRIG